jgi:hypothetical protein
MRNEMIEANDGGVVLIIIGGSSGSNVGTCRTTAAFASGFNARRAY